MRPAFDKSLKSIVQPAMQKHGFEFNGKRDFVKLRGGEEFSVNFQLGLRALSGKFTVNLVAGENTERLGSTRENWWSKFIVKAFGDYDPWWKGAFLPKEKWWEISESDVSMEKTMKDVLFILERQGLRWLEGHAT